MVGFFHGSSGGKSLNMHKNPKTRSVVGSMVDSDTNEIHQITTNSIGEMEVITKNVNDFIDDDDEMVIPVTRVGFFGGRNLVETPMLRSFRAKLTDPRSLNDGNGDSIDVMVVWTKTAECKNSGLRLNCRLGLWTRENMMDKIHQAVDETNTAFALSGIGTQLRLVHACLDSSYDEIDKNQALQDVTFKNGKLDHVHKERGKFGADLVSLL